MGLPAPVVTIVNPACPRPDVVERDRPARVRRPEQVLAVVLAVLLIAAALAGHRLRADARAVLQLASSSLQAELADGRVLASRASGGVAGTALETVRLTAAAGPDLSVVGVRTDAGWHTAPVAGSVLRAGGELLVGLEHPVSCSQRPRLPTRLSLTVVVSGGSRRTVELPLLGMAYGVLQQAAVLCGDLDAADAVVLTASTSQSRGNDTLLELHLANRGTSSATVLGAVYAGFRITFLEDLPAALPGRPPGALDSTRLPERVLHARVHLQACGPARVVLDRAAQRRPPDLLAVQVEGLGGPGLAQLDVRGLLAYLEGDWQAACG